MGVKFSVLRCYVNDLLAKWQNKVELWVPRVLIVRVGVAGKSIVPPRTACSWALQCRSSNFNCALHQNHVHGRESPRICSLTHDESPHFRCE